MELDRNETYLILGASSDIGYSLITALNMSQKNCKIFAHCYSDSGLKRLKILQSEMENLDIVPIQSDLSVSDGADKIISVINALHSYPQKIIHLAAPEFTYSRIKNLDFEQLLKELNVNFISFSRICKEYLPLMARARYGKVAIMLTAYLLGKPPKYMSTYIASKYALMGFLKSAAAEYADKGININGIAPELMDTKFLKNLDERMIEIHETNTLMKKNMQIKELIPSILFLLSDGSNYMNGCIINISGGNYM